MATIKHMTAVCAFYFDITVFLIPGRNAILASQTGEEYKSHFLCCASSHASLCLLSSLPSRFQCPESGQWGLLHSLFLFPMHILLWDLTLKRHKAWENGAAEVFHQADSHFIIFSAWQLTSKCAFAHSLSHTHIHWNSSLAWAYKENLQSTDCDTLDAGIFMPLWLLLIYLLKCKFDLNHMCFIAFLWHYCSCVFALNICWIKKVGPLNIGFEVFACTVSFRGIGHLIIQYRLLHNNN